MFESPEPGLWQQWLLEAVAEWSERWLPILRGEAGRNDVAAKCLGAVEGLGSVQGEEAGAARARIAAVLERIVSTRNEFPRGKKTEWLKPIKEFLADADFLLSLARVQERRRQRRCRGVSRRRTRWWRIGAGCGGR